MLREPAFPDAELDDAEGADRSRASSPARSEPQADRRSCLLAALGARLRARRRALRRDASTKRSRSSSAATIGQAARLARRTSSAPRTPRSSSSATSIRTRSARCIAEQLGDWRSPKPFSDVLNRYADLATDPTTEVFDTPDKENAFFLAGMPIEMRDSHADYPALVLGNYILGQGAASRLFGRIRGREGLSYGVGSGFNASPRSDGAHVHGQRHLRAAERRESRSLVPRRARDGAARRLYRGRARRRKAELGARRGRSRARKTAAWPARSASGRTSAARWPGTPSSRRACRR